MPPCGYREPAIAGIKKFYADNLSYFIELYQSRAMSPKDAIMSEFQEIERIHTGGRGGEWSAVTVLLNKLFYQKLQQSNPSNWLEVRVVGELLIKQADEDLSSLL